MSTVIVAQHRNSSVTSFEMFNITVHTHSLCTWKTRPCNNWENNPTLSGECWKVHQSGWDEMRFGLILWRGTQTNIPNNILRQSQRSDGEVKIKLRERRRNISRQLETAYECSGQTFLSVENPQSPALALYVETNESSLVSQRGSAARLTCLWLSKGSEPHLSA